MASSIADAAAFRNAAVSGQIGVDPDAAQTVLQKIRVGKDAIEALLTGAGTLAEAPKLGANPVGQAISEKFSTRADGSGESYKDALRNLYAQYDDAEQAVVTAMSRYHEMEQSASDALRSQG